MTKAEADGINKMKLCAVEVLESVILKSPPWTFKPVDTDL